MPETPRENSLPGTARMLLVALAAASCSSEDQNVAAVESNADTVKAVLASEVGAVLAAFKAGKCTMENEEKPVSLRMECDDGKGFAAEVEANWQDTRDEGQGIIAERLSIAQHMPELRVSVTLDQDAVVGLDQMTATVNGPRSAELMCDAGTANGARSRRNPICLLQLDPTAQRTSVHVGSKFYDAMRDELHGQLARLRAGKGAPSGRR